MLAPQSTPPDAAPAKPGFRWLGLILGLALAVRLAAGFAWQSRLGELRFEFGDSETYWTLARTIAQGEPYEYAANPAFRMPGYPLLLSPLFLLRSADPPVIWARMLTALYGTLAVLATWWLARRLVGPRAALVAAAIAALYPGQVVAGAFVLSEAPFCAVMVASLAAWAAACQTPTLRAAAGWALIAGLLSGAACLIRPSWLLFVPFASLGLLACATDRRRAAREAALVMLGLAVALTPWWVRNYRVTGHFVPTTLQVGASLYDGLNPKATGASDMRFVSEFRVDTQNGVTSEAETALRLDRQLRDAAIQWGVSHPKQVLCLAGVKFLRLWNVWPNEARYSSLGVRLLVIFTFVPTLILGIMGIYRTIGWGRAYWLCWMPAVYLTALHLVFVSSLRYREPAMLPLAVLAVVAIFGERGTTAHRHTDTNSAKRRPIVVTGM